MSDYRTDADRFLDEQELHQRDMKHRDNLQRLAAHLHVSPDEVIGILRPKSGYRRLDQNGQPLGVEFKDAPRYLTRLAADGGRRDHGAAAAEA